MRIGSKFSFLAGLAVGYYFGTGAGPERREQLDRALRRVEDNPQVRRLRDTVRRNAEEVAGATSHRVERTMDAASHRVAESVDTLGAKVEGAVGGDEETPGASYG